MQVSPEIQPHGSRPGDAQGLEELRNALEEGNLDRIEEIWVEMISEAEKAGRRLEGLLDVGESLCRQGGADPAWRERAGALLELLLSSCVTPESPAQAVLRLYRLLVCLFPHKREYAAGFAESYERFYPVASPERAFFEASGFATSADPAAALRRLENLLKFKKGAYVVHDAGWGVGRVVAVDPFLKQIKVDLQHKPGHRIAIDAVDSILEPLAPDSFIVLSHEKSEELKRMRDTDPVKLVALVIESFGNPLVLKDIKRHLVPGVIDPEDWSKWWNRAKGLLRESGFFRVGDRSPYPVERVEAAISYAGELLAQFERADWQVARKLARQALRQKGGELAGAWQSIRERLLGIVERSSEQDAVRALEAALILDRDDDEREAGAILARLLERPPPREIAARLQEISGSEDQRRAAQALPQSRPADWQETAILLFLGKSEPLREAALDLLEAHAPQKAASLARELLQSPQSGPAGFCFFLRETLKGSQRPSLAAFRTRGEQDLLCVLFDLLDHIHHRGQREGRLAVKDAFARVYALLEADEHRFFTSGVEAMNLEQRQDVHARLLRNQIMPPELKAPLLVVLAQIEPAIAHASKTAVWEEDAIYVTPEGLSRKRNEFRELMEVKLPANFEAIGRAAAFGDLSENAEYTSALEERDHLTKRAGSLKAELDKAKTITPDMAQDGVVSLGSRVRLLNLTAAEEVTYSILGPWDGGPEEGVLSYRSPLGRSLLERKQGEEVLAVLPGGKEAYRILEISSYFEGT